MLNLKTVKSASHEAEMRRLVRMVEECWEVAECYWIVCADSCFAFVPAALDRKLIGRFVKTEQDCFQWPTLRAKSCRKEVTGTDFTVIPITFL